MKYVDEEKVISLIFEDAKKSAKESVDPEKSAQKIAQMPELVDYTLHALRARLYDALINYCGQDVVISIKCTAPNPIQNVGRGRLTVVIRDSVVLQKDIQQLLDVIDKSMLPFSNSDIEIFIVVSDEAGYNTEGYIKRFGTDSDWREYMEPFYESHYSESDEFYAPAAKESFDNDFVVEQRGDLLYFDDRVIGLSKKAENKDSVTIDGASIGSLNDLPEDIYSIYSSKVYPNLKSVNLGNVAVMESNFLKLCCPNLEAVANIDYHNYEEQELFYYGALAELPKLQFLRINSDNIYEGAFNSNRLLEQVELGHSVGTIPVRAFEDCSALTDVVFTSNLSRIEKNAFAGCVSLRQLSTEDNFTKEDWDNLDIDPTAFTGVPRDCKVVLYDEEFPLFDDGSSGSIATEEAKGNMDEANRLRAEADRLEKLEDNSGGRVDYSDEVNELENRAAKEAVYDEATMSDADVLKWINRFVDLAEKADDVCDTIKNSPYRFGERAYAFVEIGGYFGLEEETTQLYRTLTDLDITDADKIAAARNYLAWLGNDTVYIVVVFDERVDYPYVLAQLSDIVYTSNLPDDTVLMVEFEVGSKNLSVIKEGKTSAWDEGYSNQFPNAVAIATGVKGGTSGKISTNLSATSTLEEVLTEALKNFTEDFLSYENRPKSFGLRDVSGNTAEMYYETQEGDYGYDEIAEEFVRVISDAVTASGYDKPFTVKLSVWLRDYGETLATHYLISFDGKTVAYKLDSSITTIDDAVNKFTAAANIEDELEQKLTSAILSAGAKAVERTESRFARLEEGTEFGNLTSLIEEYHKGNVWELRDLLDSLEFPEYLPYSPVIYVDIYVPSSDPAVYRRILDAAERVWKSDKKFQDFELSLNFNVWKDYGKYYTFGAETDEDYGASFGGAWHFDSSNQIPDSFYKSIMSSANSNAGSTESFKHRKLTKGAKEGVASKKFTHRFTDEEIRELERKDKSIGYVNCQEARSSSYGDPCSDESYYVGKDEDKYYLASVYGYADGDTSDGIYEEFDTIDGLNDAIARIEFDGITYKGNGSAKESCTRKRIAKESKYDEVAVSSFTKEFKKLGYEKLWGDDGLYVVKPIEGVDVYISPEDKKGKIHDDFVVTIHIGSIDKYAETDADIDTLADKCKKALAKGKADLEKVKKMVGNTSYKSAHESLMNMHRKSAKEGLSSAQQDAITDEAVKLYERYLREHSIKECDVTGAEFRKILDYIMKHSSVEISAAQKVPDYYGRYTKETAKESFAKTRRVFKK